MTIIIFFVYFIFDLDISAGPGEFSMNLTGTGFVIPDSVSVQENSNKNCIFEIDILYLKGYLFDFKIFLKLMIWSYVKASDLIFLPKS